MLSNLNPSKAMDIHRLLFFIAFLVNSIGFAQSRYGKPFLYLPMNNNLNDSTGNQYHATNSGATFAADRFGRPNKALNFDGKDDKIVIKDLGTKLPVNDYSISFWLKKDANTYTSSNTFMVMPDVTGNRYSASLYYSHSGVSSHFVDFGSLSKRIFYQPDDPDSKWNFFEIVVRTDTVLLLKNNILLSSLNSPNHFVNRSGDLVIGMGKDGYMSGIIDDFKIGMLDPLSDTFSVFNTCLGDSTSFVLITGANYDSVDWDFGDLTSGVKNASKKMKNIFHTYAKPGNYSIKLSYYRGNNVFENSKIITIKMPDKPFIGNDTLVCEGSILQIGANRNFNTYAWNTGSVGKSVNLSKEGIYILYTKDVSGCKASDTIEVKISSIPKPYLGRDTSFCNKFKEVIRPQMDYFEYEWNNGFKTKTIDVTKKGVYILKATNINGCSKSDTISIGNPLIEANFAISDSIQCLKGNYFIFKDISVLKDCSKEISTFSFFDLSINDTIIERSFSNQGKYTATLLVKTKEGCSDIKSKTVEVKMGSISRFTTDNACENDSVIFMNHSLNAGSYLWKFGDGEFSTSISPKHLYRIDGATRTYSVVLITSLNGECHDTASHSVTINIKPKSGFSSSISKNLWNFIPTETGNLKYKWLFGDGDSAISEIAEHMYRDNKTSHIVCLQVINIAKCTSETCRTIITLDSSSIHRKSFIIYPNPGNGFFHIETEIDLGNLDIEVFDALGRLVKSILLIPFNKSYVLDLDVASGIYIIRINNMEHYNQKVTVLK